MRIAPTRTDTHLANQERAWGLLRRLVRQSNLIAAMHSGAATGNVVSSPSEYNDDKKKRRAPLACASGALLGNCVELLGLGLDQLGQDHWQVNLARSWVAVLVRWGHPTVETSG